MYWISLSRFLIMTRSYSQGRPRQLCQHPPGQIPCAEIRAEMIYFKPPTDPGQAGSPPLSCVPTRPKTDREQN